MKREQKLKQPEDYQSIIEKELEYYGPLAQALDLSEDVLVQAAQLGVRDGIYRHRQSEHCTYREEECVRWNVRHLIDLTLVRTALLAASEEEIEKAEAILMRLIED